MDEIKQNNIPTNKKSSKIFSRLFILTIFLAGIYLVFLGPYKNKFFPKISGVPDLNFFINQNEKFILPEKITVKMTNDKFKEMPITWSGSSVDTTSPGLKTLTGTISDYDGKISLKANVLPHKILTKLSSTTVENSLVQINIKVPSNVNRMLFQIKKGDYIDKVVANVSNGAINSKVALPYGAGKYTLTLYTTNTTEGSAYFNYYSEIQVTNKDTRDTTFLLPNDYIESGSNEIIILANNIIAGCKTDLEKTKAIYDWVASNISYDLNAYYNNDIRNYTSLETLNGKTALCNGYANLTAALNRAIGIKTKIISGNGLTYDGTSIRHAWNETLIEGRWISQDTTWAAGGIDPSTGKFVKQYSNKFFNPSLEDFAKTHLKESER